MLEIEERRVVNVGWPLRCIWTRHTVCMSSFRLLEGFVPAVQKKNVLVISTGRLRLSSWNLFTQENSSWVK